MKDSDFRKLDEGYQSRIASQCVSFLTDKSEGDLCGLFDKILFHTTKENGETMTHVWFYLLEKRAKVFFFFPSNVHFPLNR